MYKRNLLEFSEFIPVIYDLGLVSLSSDYSFSKVHFNVENWT